MVFNLYKNEVLADLLNTIPPKTFTNLSNKEIGHYLKQRIINAAALEMKLSYVSKDELKTLRSRLNGRNQEIKTTAQRFIAAVINSDYQKILDLIDENNELKKLLEEKIRSNLQSAIAKNKRPDSLKKALDEIVKSNPKISEEEVKKILRSSKYDDISYEKHGGVIYIPSKDKEIPITSLKSRLSRAKQDLKKLSH